MVLTLTEKEKKGCKLLIVIYFIFFFFVYFETLRIEFFFSEVRFKFIPKWKIASNERFEIF